ncbi:MAG: HtrA protease/chaperone protein [Burkholderiaceae bacterium]|nr:MAG: HtrA protease/chaperone protein [Burkholderiaceae bacterium]
MRRIGWDRVRAGGGALTLAAAMVLAGGAALLPAMPAMAQVRVLPDFTDLVDQVGPSVVNIRTLEKVSSDSGGPDADMQEFFRRFFGVPMPGTPRRAPPQNGGQPGEEQPRGVGSGFILTPDGYIMTNAHVIDGADEVMVTLTDKREFKAKIVGADKRTDIAVVKINATGLPAVKIGDVSRLKVGEWVMAIGSPFGLDNTVTAGIVSAKQRDTGDYLPLIQTDVAINPGNSGGPLINMRGEVVGINSQIYSRSGGFMGISFAIPIDEAKRVADQLRATGHVTRGRIGVQIEDVRKDVADAAGLPKPTGALVRGVENGSPADKAGVLAGDVILRFDGKTIDRASDLPRLVGDTKPGTHSTLTVFRRGATKDLGVTIAELDSEPIAKSPTRAKPPSGGAAPSLGLSVSDLTDEQKRDLKLSGGVRVDAVSQTAQRAGMRQGDVIVAIANTQVGNVKEFEAAVAKADKSKPVGVMFRRGDWAQYALIHPSQR